MGACFVLERAPNSSTADLNQWFAKRLRKLKREHGSNGYTGTFLSSPGVKVVMHGLYPKKFTNSERAIQWLCDNHVKYQNVLAVKTDENSDWILGAWCSE
jgi:hypothetical protein